jgi:glutathione synthase/RimK-type ligase-like ATP-grasp enzyme
VILLWGVPGDLPMDRVRAALGARRAPVAFLDQRYGPVQELRVELHDGALTGTLVQRGGLAIDLSEVRAAYLRPVATDQACFFEGPDDPRRAAVEALELAMLAWADCTHATVINRPAAMAANNAKPYQLAMIAHAGFDVPQTIVTTTPDIVRAFAQRHGRVIYKSVSGVRSIVHRLDVTDLERIGCVANCPTQFQEYIPGTDVRVHVVGDSVFATAIECAEDDYRYAGRVHAEVRQRSLDLPATMAERCCRMVREMDLLLAGIDLRRTPDGRWVCFEVNPSPAFPYYDREVPGRIEAAIAALLLGKET